MALVPCKVCGTLNSEDAEICLSCEYPTRGRKRPAVFQWAAIVLLVLFSAPVINFGLEYLRSRSKPQRSSTLTPLVIHNR
ncbi:MAG: hypothetical protein AAGB01_04730 [Cyanobacteria bacterium P01_F01_bin.42]